MLFYQSGGCCDGSAPMIYPVSEFRIGDNDILVGKIANCNFYMAKDQFKYWKHTHLTVDVLKTTAGGFSYEVPLGFKFVIRSRLFSKEEVDNLEDVFIGNEVYKS